MVPRHGVADCVGLLLQGGLVELPHGRDAGAPVVGEPTAVMAAMIEFCRGGTTLSIAAGR